MNTKIKKDRENIMIALAKNAVDQITVQPVVDIFLLPWVSLCVFSQIVISSSGCSSAIRQCSVAAQSQQITKKRKRRNLILMWMNIFFWLFSISFFLRVQARSIPLSSTLQTLCLTLLFHLIWCAVCKIWFDCQFIRRQFFHITMLLLQL